MRNTPTLNKEWEKSFPAKGRLKCAWRYEGCWTLRKCLERVRPPEGKSGKWRCIRDSGVERLEKKQGHLMQVPETRFGVFYVQPEAIKEFSLRMWLSFYLKNDPSMVCGKGLEGGKSKTWRDRLESPSGPWERPGRGGALLGLMSVEMEIK